MSGAPNLPAPYMAKALTWRGVTIDTLGHFAVERHGVEGHVVGREEACLMYHNQANGMYQNAERDVSGDMRSRADVRCRNMSVML